MSADSGENSKKAATDGFARNYNLNPESIKEAYKRFQIQDKDKSGLIDYSEFCEILQMEMSPEDDHQSYQVFRLYDYNRTGQIDAREFLIATSNSNYAGTAQFISATVTNQGTAREEFLSAHSPFP